MKRSTLIRLVALAGLNSVLAGAALAQSYPNRPVKIVVPFATGGPADNYARYMAQKLQDALGQSFVVDNRPGGGSVIGTDIAAKATADGYTLLMMSNTHTANETLIPNKPFGLLRDFVAIAAINYSDLLLVAHPGTGIHSVADLLAKAKAHVLDTLASMVSGSVMPAGHAAVAYVQRRFVDNPLATAPPGTTGATPPRWSRRRRITARGWRPAWPGCGWASPPR